VTAGPPPLFAYGTLRSSGVLADLYFPADVRREPAMIEGFEMYCVAHGCAYPVIVETRSPTQERTDPRVVYGEIVYGDRADLRAALEMEQRAGYEIRTVHAMTETGFVPAVACVWPTHRSLGRRITSGNWHAR
jgi:gamma-glutamylcyclotransferase (GGCT)/AIG2-like uncharacterized protein YtfP